MTSFVSLHTLLDDFFDELDLGRLEYKNLNLLNFNKYLNVGVDLNKDNKIINKDYLYEDDFFDVNDKKKFSNKIFDLKNKNQYKMLMKNRFTEMNISRPFFFYYDFKLIEHFYSNMYLNIDIRENSEIFKFYKFFYDLKKFRNLIKFYTTKDNINKRYFNFSTLKNKFTKEIIEYDLTLINLVKSFFLLTNVNNDIKEIFVDIFNKNKKNLIYDLWEVMLVDNNKLNIKNINIKYGTHQWFIYFLKYLLKYKNYWWFNFILKNNFNYSFYLPKVNFENYDNLNDLYDRLLIYNKYFLKRKFWEKGWTLIDTLNLKNNKSIKKNLLKKQYYLKMYWIYIQGLLDKIYNKYNIGYISLKRFFKQYIYYIFIKYYLKRSLYYVDVKTIKRKLFFLKKRLYTNLDKSTIRILLGQSYQFRWLKYKIYKLNKIWKKNNLIKNDLTKYPMLIDDLLENIFYRYFSLYSSNKLGLLGMKNILIKLNLFYQNNKYKIKMKENFKNINLKKILWKYQYYLNNIYIFQMKMPFWYRRWIKKNNIEKKNIKYIYKYFEKKINLELFLLNLKSLNNFLVIKKNENLIHLEKINFRKLSFFILNEYNNFFGFNSRIYRVNLLNYSYNKALNKILQDYNNIYKNYKNQIFSNFNDFWSWIKFLKKGVKIKKNIKYLVDIENKKKIYVENIKKFYNNKNSLNNLKNYDVNSEWGWFYWYMWWLFLLEDFIGQNWEDATSFSYLEEQFKSYVNLMFYVGYKKINNNKKSDYPLDVYNLRLFQYFPYNYGQKAWIITLLPEIEIFNYSPLYDINYLLLWDFDKIAFSIRNVENNKKNLMNLFFFILLEKNKNNILNQIKVYDKWFLNLNTLKSEYNILYFFLKKLNLWVKLKKKKIKKNRCNIINLESYWKKNKEKNKFIKKVLKDTLFSFEKLNKVSLLWDNKLLFNKNIDNFNNNWQSKIKELMLDLLYVKVGKRSYGRKLLDHKIFVDFDTQFIEGTFRFELLEGCNYSFTDFNYKKNSVINGIGENDLDTEFLKNLNFLEKNFDNYELINILSNKKEKDILKNILVNTKNKTKIEKKENIFKDDFTIFNYLEQNSSWDFLNKININNLSVLNNLNKIKVKNLNQFTIFLKNLKIVNVEELKEILLNKASLKYNKYSKFFDNFLKQILKDLVKINNLNKVSLEIISYLNNFLIKKEKNIYNIKENEWIDSNFLIKKLFDDVKVNNFLIKNLDMHYIHNYIINIFQNLKTKEYLNKKKDETSFVYLNNSLKDFYELEKIFWQKIVDIIWNFFFNFINIEIFGDEINNWCYKKYKQLLLLDFDFENNKLIYNYPEYCLDYLYGKSTTYDLSNLEIIKDNMHFFNLNLLLNYRWFWENHYYFWNKLKLNIFNFNLKYKYMVYFLPIICLNYNLNFFFKLRVLNQIKVMNKNNIKKYKIWKFFLLKNYNIFLYYFYFFLNKNVYIYLFIFIKWLYLIILKCFSIKFYSQNELGIDVLDKEDLWSNDDFYVKEDNSIDLKSFWEYFFNLGLVNNESKFFIKFKQLYFLIIFFFSDVYIYIYIYILKKTEKRIKINYGLKLNYLNNKIFNLMLELIFYFIILFFFFKLISIVIWFFGFLFFFLIYIIFLLWNWYWEEDRNEMYEFFENYEYAHDKYTYDYFKYPITTLNWTKDKYNDDILRSEWDYSNNSLEFPVNYDIHDELKHIGEWNKLWREQRVDHWHNMDLDSLGGYIEEESKMDLKTDTDILDLSVMDNWILDVYEEWIEPEENLPVFFFIWLRFLGMCLIIFYFLFMFFLCLFFIVDSSFFPFFLQNFFNVIGSLLFIDFQYEPKYFSIYLWFWNFLNMTQF